MTGPSDQPHNILRHSLPLTRQRIYVLLFFFCLYLLLYGSSNKFHTTDLRATPWNPETGIAVAAGVLLGWPAIPVVFAANFVGNLVWGSGYSTGWNAIAATAHALLFCGSAVALRPLLGRLRDGSAILVLLFLAYGTFATALSAGSRLIISVQALQISPEYLYRYTAAVSVGNLIGIVTVTPIFVVFGSVGALITYFRSWRSLQALFLVLIGVATILVFGVKGTDEFKFFYLLFIPVIAFAARDGMPGAAFSILATDIAMILILFYRDFEPSTALELQILMSSLSATGLFLGGAVSESRNFARQLDASRQRLQDAQTALLQASRLSLASEMAAALAHELNQPLTAIRNFARSVRRQLDQPRFERKSLRANIDQAVREVDSAAKLIKNTRDFLGRGEPTYTSFGLAGLLDTCISLSDTELRSAGIELAVSRPGRLPNIRGNTVQLQQVILNLLRNSKDSLLNDTSLPRRIRLDVSLLNRPGQVEISIADNGPGVDPATRDALFTPLKSTKPDGLGLGLSLCKTIVTAHGGEIWHDGGYKQGSRFAFTLPLLRGNLAQ